VAAQFGADIPAGLYVTNSGSSVQIFVPDVTLTSGSVTYCVQSAANGTTLPVNIPSNQIAWSEPTMFRNRLINGNFDIWQRGTSQTAEGYGSDDRWANTGIGTTKTHSRQSFVLGQTEVPGNPSYFSRTVVSSVAGAGNLAVKGQRIEGAKTLAGQTATLSFYAKADAAKNIAVEFIQIFGTGGSPSSTVLGIGVTTFALTSVWAKYSVSVSIPSVSGKVLGSNNDDYLGFNFWFDAGSSLNARTNSLGQQSGTFDVAQVQLEPGTVATPFEFRPYGTELQLCERYCQLVGPSVYTYGSTLGTSDSTTSVYFEIPHRQVMRATPTSVTLSTGTPKFTGAGAATITLPSPSYAGMTAYASRVGSTSASGLTSKTLYALSDCLLLVSAEL
jgi:hypothetical protein